MLRIKLQIAIIAAVALVFSCSSGVDEPPPSPSSSSETLPSSSSLSGGGLSSSSLEVSSSSDGISSSGAEVSSSSESSSSVEDLSSSDGVSSSGAEVSSSSESSSSVEVSSSSDGVSSSGVEVSSSSETLPSSSSGVEMSSSSEDEDCYVNSALNCTTIQIPSSTSGGVIKPSSSSFAGQGVKIEGETVTYHGEDYPTVVIGTQTWFAKNLNYEVEGSYFNGKGSFCYTFYDGNDYCEEYGRLYYWYSAMNIPTSCIEENNCASYINTPHQGICPAGWHIPTKEEWNTLIMFVVIDNSEEVLGDENYAKYLKDKSGWNNEDNKDTYGFAALPGGLADTHILFGDKGSNGYWWTSSFDAYPYIARMEAANGDLYLQDTSISYAYLYLFSVRCLKD